MRSGNLTALKQSKAVARHVEQGLRNEDGEVKYEMRIVRYEMQDARCEGRGAGAGARPRHRAREMRSMQEEQKIAATEEEEEKKEE